jgi:hypothetical protein
MTQQTFGGLAVADPRSATAVDVAEDAGDDNRRKLAIVGAIVAVVVVLIAAFFLMKGKGGDSAATVPPHVVPPASNGSTHAAAPAKHAKTAVRLPKAYNGVVGRDPFKALYVQPADNPATAGSTGDGATSSTGATVPAGTTTPGNTSTGTTTPVTTTPGTTTPVYRPVWIRLTKLTANSATFDVGFSNHKNLKVRHFTESRPSPGSPKVFAHNFALLRLSASQVVVQFGDGTPFVLDMQHPVMIVN